MKYRNSLRQVNCRLTRDQMVCLVATCGMEKTKEVLRFFCDWGYPYFNRVSFGLIPDSSGEDRLIFCAAYTDTNNKSKKWTIVAVWDGEDFEM